MASIYKDADLIISRAGATTLSELAIMGKPAILFPYPTAADNHQEKNAQFYVEGGGAIMLNEKKNSALDVASTIEMLISDEGKRLQMGVSMRRKGFPDAAEKIISVCKSLLSSNG